MFDDKLSIKNLEQYGDQGWEWDNFVTDGSTDDVSPTHFRTNRLGEGLWECGPRDDRQVAGTVQFSLPNNKKAAYAKIRRYFEKE